MKKLFFTAIVLVAFSGISMANTSKVKKVLDETKKLNQKKEVVVTKNCGLMVSSNIGNWEELHGCLSSDSYNQLYNLMMVICKA